LPKSIKTDVINAGGAWEDSPALVDQAIIPPEFPGIWTPFPQDSSRKWPKGAIPGAAPLGFTHPRGRRLPTPCNAGRHSGFLLNNQLLELCKLALLRRNNIAFHTREHPYFAGKSPAQADCERKSPLCLPISSV
jgi:hypothetical protein